MSQVNDETPAGVLDVTVRRRHWDNDAVFKPSPNLPRSLLDRGASEPTPPNLMASTSVASSIPWPSSNMLTIGSPLFQSHPISIVVASAAILLSMMSAIA